MSVITNEFMKRLFYEKYEGNFYWVTKRPKSILIEWAEHKTPTTYNGGGEVIKWHTHDFSVKWDNDFVGGKGMTISTCGKNSKHCLKEYEDDYILVYPYQAGQPFCLEPATIEDIEKEIKHCGEWGSSNQYYKDLLKDLTPPKK